MIKKVKKNKYASSVKSGGEVVRALTCLPRGRSRVQTTSEPGHISCSEGYLSPRFEESVDGYQPIGIGHPTTNKPWAQDDHLRVIPLRDEHLMRLNFTFMYKIKALQKTPRQILIK